MRVVVNDEPLELPEGATVTDAVRRLGRDPGRPGAAVVVNGEVVPQGRWDETALGGDDRVEVVVAVQGGSA